MNQVVKFLIQHLIKDNECVSTPSVQKAYAKLCSLSGIFLNTFLFLTKLLLGTISSSSAIIADGFNNFADAVTSAAAFLGYCLAGLGAGENHQFGHGRYEWLMGFVSGLAVFFMGASLAKESVTAIQSPKTITFSVLVLFMLITSIFIKFYMYLYNKNIGNKISSVSMRATATDCISDIASTSAITLALVTEHFTGWHIDGWCTLLVSVFIMFSAVKSISETADRFMGHIPDNGLSEKITELVLQYPQVQSISNLSIHDYGMGQYAVSMHITGTATQDSADLYAAAQNISYDLYKNMNCTAVIQTDFLAPDNCLHNLMKNTVENIIHSIDENARIKNLHFVNAPPYTNILLTITGSGKTHKKELLLHENISKALYSLDNSCHVITKFLIASPEKKPQIAKTKLII